MNTAIGKSIERKDSWLKVTGEAKYTDDITTLGLLECRLLTSCHAHALIKSIDTSAALAIDGVKSALTGDDCDILFGPLLQDRPALAKGLVRYAGEPVALVVAKNKAIAEKAIRAIKVEYEPLPMVLTPFEAFSSKAPLVHTQIDSYKKVLTDIYPVSDTNVVSSYRMKKGNTDFAFKNCRTIVEQSFFLGCKMQLGPTV